MLRTTAACSIPGILRSSTYVDVPAISRGSSLRRTLAPTILLMTMVRAPIVLALLAPEAVDCNQFAGDLRERQIVFAVSFGHELSEGAIDAVQEATFLVGNPASGIHAGVGHGYLASVVAAMVGLSRSSSLCSGAIRHIRIALRTPVE